jgi:arachidonate 15-lipoxygenase
MPSPVATLQPWRLSDCIHRSLHNWLRDEYRYKSRKENALAPVSVAAWYPCLLEMQDLAWISRFLPGRAKAAINYELKKVLFFARKIGFRFDLMRAYRDLFYLSIPEYVDTYAEDDAFAYRRIAGPNALEICRVTDLGALLQKIPLRAAPLFRTLGRRIELRNEVDAGRLFEVDFQRIQRAFRPLECPPRTRDSRWRRKYLPAPIGVFLEDPGWCSKTDLRPLAIRIDQPQPNRGEPNPVYYCDGSPAWNLAKLYFEVADENTHFACGHVYRTHFVMEPFCLATARQLAFDHPINLLLHPHTRYTLATNNSAYKNFVDPNEVYFEFYAGTLEESRQLFVNSYWDRTFRELGLDADLRSRGVSSHLADYPYRDDARLWQGPIDRFVDGYVRAFYPHNAAVVRDQALQKWAADLMSPDRGAVRGLVAGDRMDTVDKLIDLLAQVLFIAGPGHASQHFSEMYYCRYSPAFTECAYAPPPWRKSRANDARFRSTLPPIKPSSLHFDYSDFGDFRFDRFGVYARYPLSRVPQAAGPIQQLQADLARVEQTIEGRLPGRMLRYDFLLPSRVPNSINI